MAFPSDIGSHQDDLAKAWAMLRSFAAAVKRDAETVRASSFAGPIGSSAILGWLTRLADYRAELVRYAAVPGLAAYAQAQINNPSLDITAEWTAMRNQMDAARDWAVANFPKDGNAWLLASQFNAQGRTTDRQFSTAALAAFRTQLDSLIATID